MTVNYNSTQDCASRKAISWSSYCEGMPSQKERSECINTALKVINDTNFICSQEGNSSHVSDIQATTLQGSSEVVQIFERQLVPSNGTHDGESRSLVSVDGLSTGVSEENSMAETSQYEFDEVCPNTLEEYFQAFEDQNHVSHSSANVSQELVSSDEVRTTRSRFQLFEQRGSGFAIGLSLIVVLMAIGLIKRKSQSTKSPGGLFNKGSFVN